MDSVRLIPRFVRALAYGGVFVLLLGFWMDGARVVEDCSSAPCAEILVSGGTEGRILLVVATVMLGTALLATVWLRARRDRSSDPHAF